MYQHEFSEQIHSVTVGIGTGTGVQNKKDKNKKDKNSCEPTHQVVLLYLLPFQDDELAKEVSVRARG